MLRASLILLTSLLLSFAVAGNLLAAEPLTELRDVEVKMVLLDVDEVNNVAQTFTANLATAIRGKVATIRCWLRNWILGYQISSSGLLIESGP